MSRIILTYRPILCALGFFCSLDRLTGVWFSSYFVKDRKQKDLLYYRITAIKRSTLTNHHWVAGTQLLDRQQSLDYVDDNKSSDAEVDFDITQTKTTHTRLFKCFARHYLGPAELVKTNLLKILNPMDLICECTFCFLA